MDTIPAFYPVGDAARDSLEMLRETTLEVDIAQAEENEKREAMEGLNFL